MEKLQARSFNFLVPGIGLEEFSTPEITFLLGQTDESNQDSTEDIAIAGNSDNTSDTPVELRKFQDRWYSLFPWVTYESKENKMFCKLYQDIGAENAMTLGTNNFKTSTLTRHASSADHQKALIAHRGS